MDLGEAKRELIERLERKRQAYRATMFTDMGVLLSRWQLIRLCLRALVSPRPAYQLTFKGAHKVPHPAAQIVLADLKRFSRFTRGGLVISPVTRTADPYATAYREGMRDMYIRILMMTGLDGGDIEDDPP
jgi:hypothetical protein